MSRVRQAGEAFDADRHSPITEPTAIAIKLLLVTGQRVGEVTGMEWSEIDLDGGWWEIPAARSKNKIAHRVPLTETAVALLRITGSHSDSEKYVFPGRKPSDKRPRAGGPIEPIKPGVANYALRRVRETAGLDHFTCHDLRRTAATCMASAGVPRLVVGKILNHAERGVTARYDRANYDSEKREALDRWEKALLSIIDVDNGGQS